MPVSVADSCIALPWADRLLVAAGLHILLEVLLEHKLMINSFVLNKLKILD